LREFFYSKSFQQNGLNLDDFGYCIGVLVVYNLSTMRSFMVVVFRPLPNNDLRFPQAIKGLAIQKVISKGAI